MDEAIANIVPLQQNMYLGINETMAESLRHSYVNGISFRCELLQEISTGIMCGTQDHATQ